MGIAKMGPIAFGTAGHRVNNIYQLNVGRFRVVEKWTHDTSDYSELINPRNWVLEQNKPLFIFFRYK